MLPGPPDASMHAAYYFSLHKIPFFFFFARLLHFPALFSVRHNQQHHPNIHNIKITHNLTHTLYHRTTALQKMPWDPLTTGAAVVVGAIALPVAIPVVIGAAGFGAGGIVAGSWAASLMASYGGTVVAGSACAVLQSVGAAGVGVAGTTLAGVVGGAAAGAAVVGASGAKGE